MRAAPFDNHQRAATVAAARCTRGGCLPRVFLKQWQYPSRQLFRQNSRSPANRDSNAQRRLLRCASDHAPATFIRLSHLYWRAWLFVAFRISMSAIALTTHVKYFSVSELMSKSGAEFMK